MRLILIFGPIDIIVTFIYLINYAPQTKLYHPMENKRSFLIHIKCNQ